VDVSICAATNRDLRKLVAQGSFREDFYFRLVEPSVRLPPLRDRREEIPWLVVEAVRRIDAAIPIAAKLVEACMLRRWPGNVRELLAATSQATRRARSEGRGALKAEYLDPLAGASVTDTDPKENDESPPRAARERPDDASIRSALESAKGNVSRAAKALGMHRSQLRRWLARRSD
jgi:transcriptional regulator of acetoin/glycerol metabolism